MDNSFYIPSPPILLTPEIFLLKNPRRYPGSADDALQKVRQIGDEGIQPDNWTRIPLSEKKLEKERYLG